MQVFRSLWRTQNRPNFSKYDVSIAVKFFLNGSCADCRAYIYHTDAKFIISLLPVSVECTPQSSFVGGKKEYFKEKKRLKFGKAVRKETI